MGRKLFAICLYTLFLLLLGRNLSFLPKIAISGNTTPTSTIEKQITTRISKEKGTYSIYYHSLSDDTSFGSNEDAIYTAASVNKVPIVAALYYFASKGKINLDDTVTLQADDMQDYGSGSLRYEQEGESYSLRTLAKFALNESDNTAAYVLSQEIGVEKIQQLVDGWGLLQTDMKNNKTSVFDMYLLFKKMYTGEITNKAQTKELLGFMKDTTTEDRIPRELPKDAVVYHKTGDAIGGIHDVGIIERGSTVFFLGILTTDIQNNEDKTKQAIADVAKDIFNFTTDQ